MGLSERERKVLKKGVPQGQQGMTPVWDPISKRTRWEKVTVYVLDWELVERQHKEDKDAEKGHESKEG
jgi:hypothetical protein